MRRNPLSYNNRNYFKLIKIYSIAYLKILPDIKAMAALKTTNDVY